MEIKPNSIEELFKGVSTGEKYDFTDEESIEFINITQMSNQQTIDKIFNELLSKSIPINIFYDRLQINPNLKIDKKIVIYTGINLDIPGNMVTFAAYCLYKLKQNKIKNEFTWDAFVKYIIPMGFPNKTFFNEIWDLQKSNNGYNLLDKKDAYQSLINY